MYNSPRPRGVLLVPHKGAGVANRPRQLQKKSVSSLPPARGNTSFLLLPEHQCTLFLVTQTVCWVTFLQLANSHFLPRGLSTWLMISSVNDSNLLGTAQVEFRALLWGLLPCQPPAHLWQLGRASFPCSLTCGTGEVGGELQMLEKTAATSCPPEDSK